MLSNLNKYTILLASKSPRRRELLHLLRIPFKVVTIGGIDESYPSSIPLLDVPQYVSIVKADAFQKHIGDDELVITADTMVICGNFILGKPKDREDAVNMLMNLSGKTHQVATGVTISTKWKRTSFTTVTDVTFAGITEEEIRYYVDNYMPLDKAGAYGIQEWIGCVAIQGIRGCFYNVMGLPLHTLYRRLRDFKV